MARKKKVKLTVREIRMLDQGIPNKDTWICAACGMFNAGSDEECSWDGVKRPTNPQLLWPEYVKACEKVGLDPEKKQRFIFGTRGPLVFDKERGRWIDFESAAL